MYCTGVGKAMMACMSDEEVDRIWDSSDIQAYTPHTIVTPRAPARRARGRAPSGLRVRQRGEHELGVRCIAAAIRDYTGKVCGALSISAPLMRMSDSYLAQLQPALLATRDRIAS